VHTPHVLCQSVTSNEIEGKQFEVGLKQYQANRHIEDRFSYRFLRSPKDGTNSKPWFAASVFDGHGGWQVSEYLSKKLHDHFDTAFDELDPSDSERVILNKHGSIRVFPSTRPGGTPKPEDKHAAVALQNAFDVCDAAIADQIFPAAIDFKFSRVERVGSCALSVLVNDESFIVANAGDCQAVLVRGNDGLLLNFVHNANVPLEQERMKLLKPKEDGIVCKKSRHYDNGMSCRVKGMLQPTRSFGDFHLKSDQLVWDYEFGRPFLPHEAKDFPYITAHPDVTVVERDAKLDKWLVLGSDGLWDYVSPQEIVQHSSICNSPQELADLLTDLVLNKTAERTGLSIENLKALSPGPNRRSLHDDVTVLVVKLNPNGI